MKPRLAYIMSRFPHLPETFILREMAALEDMGWPISIYPLIVQDQGIVHEEARPWMARLQAAPYLSGEVISENLRQLRRCPRPYTALWRQVLWENRTSPNFLIRAAAIFPKAVVLARKMQAEGVAHIHAHYASHPALMAWLVSRLTGIPYSFTAHAHDIYVRTAMLTTKLRDAQFVVPISQFNYNYLANLAGDWVREKMHVVHCGVNVNAYTPIVRQRAGNEPLKILNIGSLQPYKGQAHLVSACACLRKRGIPFQCRIIGGGQLRAGLEEQIHQLGLEGQVELLGPRTQADVARLLAEANCYAQPSVITPAGKMEGIPVSLMEAMVTLLPVVATRISGIPELVRDGETGWLVPPADDDALADALAEIFMNPSAASLRAAAGRNLVLEEFDLIKNAQKLSAIFEQSLNGKFNHPIVSIREPFIQ